MKLVTTLESRTKTTRLFAETVDRINHVAFGFRAYRSRDIAVETSRTFQVVSRFHRAIGVITIVASSVFLLCIMVLKVEERRRDIAALRLMGISRWSVVQSIIIEAALVAVESFNAVPSASQQKPAAPAVINCEQRGAVLAAHDSTCPRLRYCH